MGRFSLFRAALKALVVGLGLNCSLAQAGLMFQFGTEQGPGFSQYTVAPGSLLNLNIYLYETVTAPDNSQLVTENGLTSAQFTIQRTSSSSGLPAIISSYTANTTEFDDSFGPVENFFDSAELDLTQFVDIGAASGVLGDDLTGGIRRVLLATLGITASSEGGQITSFSLSDNLDNPALDETVTFVGTAIDSLLNVGQIEVRTTGTAAVPEPTTASLCILAMGVGFLVTCRRRSLADPQRVRSHVVRTPRGRD